MSELNSQKRLRDHQTISRRQESKWRSIISGDARDSAKTVLQLLKIKRSATILDLKTWLPREAGGGLIKSRVDRLAEIDVFTRARWRALRSRSCKSNSRDAPRVPEQSQPRYIDLRRATASPVATARRHITTHAPFVY